MKILNSIKNLTGLNIPENSLSEKSGNIDQAIKDPGATEGVLNQQAKSTLSKALSQVTEVGTDAIGAFLKTKEGKIILMQLAKPVLKKYWWALAGIVTFEAIGIFATIKYPLSKR
jgi:hypothetical protein